MVDTVKRRDETVLIAVAALLVAVVACIVLGSVAERETRKGVEVSWNAP